MVSNRYKVVQPAEVLEFYRDLTDAGGFRFSINWLSPERLQQMSRSCWAATVLTTASNEPTFSYSALIDALSVMST
ncbi:DUF932 domain-containing protein [Dechloromonas sp. ZS-1]|uniref:DUF932 domain-containing protein n=1 Tax=Dechloromonas sp. ZS-1 TaxID=3138067 RepID=UPI0031FBC099